MNVNFDCCLKKNRKSKLTRYYSVSQFHGYRYICGGSLYMASYCVAIYGLRKGK